MPCRSEYMEPTPHEKYCQKTAILLYNFRKFLNLNLKDGLAVEKSNIYCNRDFTEALCDLITKNKFNYSEFIVSDNPLAADLHMWWVNHQKVDAKRIAKEEEEKRIETLAKQAINKLTEEELQALLSLNTPRAY